MTVSNGREECVSNVSEGEQYAFYYVKTSAIPLTWKMSGQGFMTNISTMTSSELQLDVCASFLFLWLWWCLQSECALGG